MDKKLLYKILPVKLIQYHDGTLVKRGVFEIHISGRKYHKLLESLQQILKNPHSIEDLNSIFPECQQDLYEVLELLVARKIVVPDGEHDNFELSEKAEDIFYWNFNRTKSSIHESLGKISIVVVGINDLSKQVIESMIQSGFPLPQLVDYSPLRNPSHFGDDSNLSTNYLPYQSSISYNEWLAVGPKSAACVIATSDYGNNGSLRSINQICINANVPFYPISLSNLIGYLGPLILPGESACFECLRIRQNSNFEDAGLIRAAESHSETDAQINGFHPLMLGIVAQLATMELVKFFTQLHPSLNHIGELLEINLMLPAIATRRVLKVPFCPICSYKNNASAISTLRQPSVIDGLLD